ncbi:MAG: hypothetical protein DRJ09_00535 [Bacteroidetes bacterium]|nr:MAG: hypothetical protein DRJ09_00535 [Bacteroidota bacterium]
MLTASGLKSLQALISMVDDPDDRVYSSLKSRLLSYEEDALPPLKEAWMAATDLLVVSRLGELLDEINFRLIYNELKAWLLEGSKGLTKVMFLVNRLGDKNFDDTLYQSKIELLFKDAWLEMNENLTALEQIKVLNHIFFSIHHYNSNPDINDVVDDFFIARLMDTKEGNATSMGLLYLSIARYLKLPVYGVNLPGHLILAYVDDRFKLKDQDSYSRDDVLFYINPFNSGTVFTESEITLYIKQVNLTEKEHYYLPAKNSLIVHRYLKELQKAYARQDDDMMSDKIKQLLTLF